MVNVAYDLWQTIFFKSGHDNISSSTFPSRTLLLPHQEGESTSSPSKTGQVFVTAWKTGMQKNQRDVTSVARS